jgi:hypothetical protein
MSGGLSWFLLAPLVVRGPGHEPPPPRLDDEVRAPTPNSAEGSVEGPREGPALPPAPARVEPPGIELAPVEPGVGEDAWAVPPPRSAGEGTVGEAGDPGEGNAGSDAGQPAESWPDPGTAPGDGSGLFTAGGLVLASTPLWTSLLLRDPGLTREDRTNILIAGGGLGAIGIGFLALGGYRRAKLRRWAAAYRVEPTHQGGALLVLGGVAQGLGLTGVPVGIYWLVYDNPGWGAVATAVGAVSLGLAPLCLHFGRTRRANYLDTGGWVRRPLPQVRLAPNVLVTRGGFGFGLAGRF